MYSPTYPSLYFSIPISNVYVSTFVLFRPASSIYPSIFTVFAFFIHILIMCVSVFAVFHPYIRPLSPSLLLISSFFRTENVSCDPFVKMVLGPYIYTFLPFLYFCFRISIFHVTIFVLLQLVLYSYPSEKTYFYIGYREKLIFR